MCDWQAEVGSGGGGTLGWTLLRRLYALFTQHHCTRAGVFRPHVLWIFSSTSVPSKRPSAGFLGGFVSTSLTTNAVQQGDIERASLQRESKQFVICRNQGQRLLPPARSICTDANETSAYVGCLFFSRTDGMMSLHDEDASGGWALCLFMCDRVHTPCRDCCTS